MNQQSKTTLNPGASEFVPSFAMPNMSGLSISGQQNHQATHQQNQQYSQQRYQNGGNNYNNQPYYQQQQNNNNNNNYYNQNRSGNSYNQQNHHYRNNNNNNNYNQNSYYNGNGNTQYNQYDVDPIELEARCEAVIEILQDDKIKDYLNPVSKYEDASTVASNNAQMNALAQDYGNQEPQYDDEEEMLEMMAMQEECRLEMMKFYIQSQNPTLFEEIYHDVSYPDAIKKPQEEELRNPKQLEAKVETEPATVAANSAYTALRDLIVNELNPNVDEFVPNKFEGEPESN